MRDLLAYIDPGSGSLIIQATIASVVGVSFFFRSQIGRAARAVRRAIGRQPPDATSTDRGPSTRS